MKEIRYAALLHDFGKVGVREEVLVKAKKLYPQQMEILAYRFDYLYKDLEARLEREKFKALLEFERAEALSRMGTLEEEYRLRRAELEEAFRAIVRANEPTLHAARGSSIACSKSPAKPIATRAASNVRS